MPDVTKRIKELRDRVNTLEANFDEQKNKMKQNSKITDTGEKCAKNDQKFSYLFGGVISGVILALIVAKTVTAVTK